MCGHDQLEAEGEMSRGTALYYLSHTSESIPVLMTAATLAAKSAGDFVSLNIALGNAALGSRRLDDFKIVATYTCGPCRWLIGLEIWQIACSRSQISRPSTFYPANGLLALTEAEQALIQARTIEYFLYLTYPLIQRGQVLLGMGDWGKSRV